MLTAQQYASYKPQGVKVWSFCPGYVVTDVDKTGEEGIKKRVANGAGSAAVSGRDIAGIVGGKRDANVGEFVYDTEGVYEW